MRIVIDMQGAQTESRYRGIGRYSIALAKALVKNRGDHEIVLLLSAFMPETIEPIRAMFDAILPQENIVVWYAPGPVKTCEPGNEWRREVAGLIRNAFIANIKPDLVHITSLFEGYGDDAVVSCSPGMIDIPVSTTLYDLIPLLNPDHYLKGNPAYAQFYMQHVEILRSASLLLAISESASREGHAALGETSPKIVNVSTAVDPHFQRVKVSVSAARVLRQNFGINEHFVLYSGGADQRKNLPRLISAYALLAPEIRKKTQLVFAGRITLDDMQHLKICADEANVSEEELCFTGYVTEEELVQLYNLCDIFVFPSWHEGFGLPLLEAMACGAAVIGANASSIPEVIGLEEALFDPFDVYSISNKISEILQNGALREKLAAHGLERAKEFSWENIAHSSIAAFLTTISARSTAPLPPASTLQGSLIERIARTVPLEISDPEIAAIADAASRAFLLDHEKQLFVDISELCKHDARTGVQRVTRSILNELVLHPPDGFLVAPVYADTVSPGYRYARNYMETQKGAVADSGIDEPISYRPGDIFLGLDLQHHVVAAQSDYLSVLRQDGVKIIFVVYDLLPILMPHFFPEGMEQVHQTWLLNLARFDGVACISRAVADEFRHWYTTQALCRQRRFSIEWFHLGADIASSKPSNGMPDNAADVLAMLGKRLTFLTVGTLEPRKGQAQLLAAVELLWMNAVDVNLVFVGKPGWMIDELATKISTHAELDKRLFWLQGISDEYLERVYAATSVLIAASEGEGFGLPLIESAQKGMPIIARDIPVFREVMEEQAFYFTGLSAEALAAALGEWMTLRAQGREPRPSALRTLNWEQSARMLFATLHG